MGFVASYASPWLAPIAWAAGEVLVAVGVVVRGDTSLPTLPSPWVRQWSESLLKPGAGGPYRAYQVTVWTCVMSSPGSAVVQPDWRTSSTWDPIVWVGRYTATDVRAVVSRRTQNELPVWPASQIVAAGDVVHVAALYYPSLPSGDVQRAVGDSHIVSDRTTTGVVAAATSTVVRTDGAALTVHLSSAPLVPTPVLVSPSTAGVEAGVVTVAWQPIDGQQSYAIRRTSGGASVYWTGTAWQSSPVTVSGSASSVGVDLPGGVWTLAVQVTVAGTASPWSAPVSVTAAAAPPAPTVAVSSWAVRRPTITLSGSAGAGATLAGILVEVVQGGEVVESALVQPGTWQPERLPDGPLTIRAAVVQNGDQVGPWREVAGTVLVPPVPAPVVEASVGWLSATATPDAPLGLPGMRMTITTSLPGTVPFEVERDGVAFAAGTITTSSDVEDYSVGGAYRVRVGDPAHDPVEWSEWVSVAAPTELDQTHWLISVQYPELSVFVDHHEYDEVAPDLRSQVSAYLDGGREHITYGVPLDARRRVQVGVRSRVGWDRLRTLLSSGLLLRMGWCPSADGTPTPSDLFRVEGFDPRRFIPTRNIDVWRVGFDIIPQDS